MGMKDFLNESIKTITACPTITNWKEQKKYMIPSVLAALPDMSNIKHYCEPMCGSAQFYLTLREEYNFDRVYLSDKDHIAIDILMAVQNSPNELIKQANKEIQTFMAIEDKKDKKAYYKAMCYAADSGAITGIEAAAWLVVASMISAKRYIDRNYNGNLRISLYISNPKLHLFPGDIEEESRKLKGAVISCSDYRECGSYVDSETLVIIDPPAIVSYDTDKKQYIYYAEEELDSWHEEAAEFGLELAAKGAKVMIILRDGLYFKRTGEHPYRGYYSFPIRIIKDGSRPPCLETILTSYKDTQGFEPFRRFLI